jgi:hypothetical protein
MYSHCPVRTQKLSGKNLISRFYIELSEATKKDGEAHRLAREGSSYPQLCVTSSLRKNLNSRT